MDMELIEINTAEVAASICEQLGNEWVVIKRTKCGMMVANRPGTCVHVYEDCNGFYTAEIAGLTATGKTPAVAVDTLERYIGGHMLELAKALDVLSLERYYRSLKED